MSDTPTPTPATDPVPVGDPPAPVPPEAATSPTASPVSVPTLLTGDHPKDPTAATVALEDDEAIKDELVTAEVDREAAIEAWTAKHGGVPGHVAGTTELFTGGTPDVPPPGC